MKVDANGAGSTELTFFPEATVLGVTVLNAITKTAIQFSFDVLLDQIADGAVKSALAEWCTTPKPSPPPPVAPPDHAPDGSTPPWDLFFRPDALIDPSGTVLDTNGNPINSATATILRSDAWVGPYAAVDPTAPGIEPGVNPETTTADGVFHWDVRSGFYEVQATAPGCTVPGEPNRSTASIGPYPVPPPQVGLSITLSCPNEPPPPTPTVQGLTANTGPGSGGTTVTVLGSGFTPSSKVMFGAKLASTVTYMSAQAITAVSPPGSGLVDVVVKTAGGSSGTSAADQFFYGSPPTVTAVSVTSGPATGGNQIRISGTGFTGATAVAFGGLPASSTVVRSDTEIQAIAPPEPAGTVDIGVLTPAGMSAPTPADRYTYLSAPPSVVITSPANGSTYAQGQTVRAAYSCTAASGASVIGCAGAVANGAAVDTQAPGPHSFTVSATDNLGSHTSKTVNYVVHVVVSVPVLTHVRQSAAIWRETKSKQKHGPPVGTTFYFTLDQPATVTLNFTQTTTGRKVGGRCVAQTNKNRTKPRCTLTTVAGKVTLTGRPGANSLQFAGRVSRIKVLRPGSYTLQITATNSLGAKSAPRTLRFTIVK